MAYANPSFFATAILGDYKMATRPIKTNSRDVLGLAETRPLPHKEILALFAQWHDNDDLSARDQIVASNMRFVAQIAHEYVDTCSLNLDELISEGIQGLFMAADRFEAERGLRFISYAVYWIRCQMRNAIAQGDRPVRLPGNVIADEYKVVKRRWQLAKKTGHIPTQSELFDNLGFTPEYGGVLDAVDRAPVRADHTRTQCRTGQYQRQSDQFDESWGSRFIVDKESTPADERVEEMNQKRAISGALRRHLDPRSRYIVRRHFGLLRHLDAGPIGLDPETMKDIGAKLGISRERVRQLKEVALNKLRTDDELRQAFAEAN